MTYTTSAMTSHRILITTEYLNVHFFSVFLFVYVLEVLKALFYANFRALGWKAVFCTTLYMYTTTCIHVMYKKTALKCDTILHNKSLLR